MIDTSQADFSETLVRPSAPEPTRVPVQDADAEIPLELQATTLDTLCRTALQEVAAAFPGRRIEYAPDPDAELRGEGEWDARRIAYAVTLLVEDALKRSAEGEPVSLRWREHGDAVVLRVQYPRPVGPGDRVVTDMEEGVRPDGADDRVGTLRLVAAFNVARQHRGRLARVRTRAGTAYVLELPRTAAAGSLDDAAW